MLTSAAPVPTVCASLCQPIHLAYDGTSFLQVVLCYQLHSPLPARKMLFVPSRTHTHNARTHHGRRGTDTCRVFVTSSVGICDRAALWERRPSVVGKAGFEGGKRARCIMLLFSVGLSCVKCCVVKVFQLLSLPFGVTQIKQYSYMEKKLILHPVSYKCNCEVVSTMLKVIVAPLEGTNTFFFHSTCANFAKAMSHTKCFGFIKTTCKRLAFVKLNSLNYLGNVYPSSQGDST